MKYRFAIVGALLLAPLLGARAQEYTADNAMTVPADYRQWVFLTSSMDLNYSSGPAGMHMLDNVFVNPGAYQAFLKTGTWPDKTILVKENRVATSTGTLAKGGLFQAAVEDLEIHVKDEARFPGKWAFFASADGKAAARLLPQSANCYSCHQDHAAVDTTFVQFYPTLLGIAKNKATFSESYRKEIADKR